MTLIYLRFPVSRPTGCFWRLTAFSMRQVAADVRAAQAYRRQVADVRAAKAYRRRRRFRRML